MLVNSPFQVISDTCIEYSIRFIGHYVDVILFIHLFCVSDWEYSFPSPHHLQKLLKEVGTVQRSRGGFRVILDGEDG